MSSLDRAKMVETIEFCNGQQAIVDTIGNPIVVTDEMSDEDVAQTLVDTFEQIKTMFDAVTCKYCGRILPEPEDSVCVFCNHDINEESEVVEEKKEETPPPPAPEKKEEVKEEVKEEEKPKKKRRKRRTKAEIAKEVEKKQEESSKESIYISDKKAEEIMKSEDKVVIEEKKVVAKPIAKAECNCNDGATEMVKFLVETEATVQIGAKNLAKVFNV